jgi:hypothetical protein
MCGTSIAAVYGTDAFLQVLFLLTRLLIQSVERFTPLVLFVELL